MRALFHRGAQPPQQRIEGLASARVQPVVQRISLCRHEDAADLLSGKRAVFQDLEEAMIIDLRDGLFSFGQDPAHLALRRAIPAA